MIEKIKNEFNNSKVNVSKGTFINNKSNIETESYELDNDLFNENDVTEEMASEAINNNFIANREVTSKMNEKVYNALKQKISDYISNNGVDIK